MTISFKIAAEIEIRKHMFCVVLRRQGVLIGFVKHTMYVLSFIHCLEMRLYRFCFVCLFLFLFFFCFCLFVLLFFYKYIPKYITVI